ncbi:hypothetical protein GCM10022380_72480 [Amycolatopsis tucumanensis]|uniref:Uncharacterized protein n=1 Tax=Amycolatopsis tucumanensis TaxID=401106 RepID=A0ABP7JFE0_9PSEU
MGAAHGRRTGHSSRAEARPDAEPAQIWTALVDDLCLMSFVARTQQDEAGPVRARGLDVISRNNLLHAQEIATACGGSGMPDRIRLTRRPPREWWPSGLFHTTDQSWPSVVARGLVLAAGLVVLARSHLADATAPGWRTALALVERGQSRQFGQWRMSAGQLIAEQDRRPEFEQAFRATLARSGDLYRAGEGGACEVGDVQAHYALPVVLRRSGLPRSWLDTWCDYPRRRRNATASRAATRLIDEMRVRRDWPQRARARRAAKEVGS